MLRLFGLLKRLSSFQFRNFVLFISAVDGRSCRYVMTVCSSAVDVVPIFNKCQSVVLFSLLTFFLPLCLLFLPFSENVVVFCSSIIVSSFSL